MSELKAWLKETQAERLTSQGWASCWALHLSGASLYHTLLKRLNQEAQPVGALREPQRETQEAQEAQEAFRALLEGEARLRERFLSLPAEELDSQELRRRTQALSDELTSLTRDTQLDDERLTRHLLVITHEMRLIKRLAAHCSHIQEPYQADLINEVFGLLEGDAFSVALEQGGLSARFSSLYREGLNREVRFLEGRLAEELEPLERWRLLLWASELQVNISTSPHSNEELIQRCESARAALRGRVEYTLEALTGSARDELLEERAWELSHHMSDLLGRIDHSELTASIKKLECIYVDLMWFQRYTPQGREARKTLKSRAPKLLSALDLLSKKRALVRAELQEKRLQQALEGRFGHSFIKRSEQVIAGLIILVLVLLFFELSFVSEENIELRKSLALIDTGICFIFLVEFFTKLSLSDDKKFYFKRRWFIDLLPSIPFVLFTDYFLLDHLVSGRAARFARLSRFVRYLRIVRPFIRLIRLISFTLRGLDRFVRRYSKWLNQNLVFFEPNQAIHRHRQVNLFECAHEGYGRALHALRTSSARLPHKTLSRLLPAYVVSLERHLDWKKAPIALGLQASVGEVRRKDIPVEQAIYTLLNLHGAQLETYLGSDFPRYVYFYMGLLDVPVVRSLPLLRDVLERRRHSSSAEFSAWIVRSFGRLLELLMNLAYWFADLYGILTGPKIIDRVGNALVRTFQNPAKRFLIFGTLLLISHLVVSALDVPLFSPALSLMQRLFGLPVIILGVICLIPFITGRKMMKIAGQATDLYRLTAEAQYINLLKELKESNERADLRLIYRRVLRPELLIGAPSLPQSPPSCEAEVGDKGAVAGVPSCDAFIETTLARLDEKLEHTTEAPEHTPSHYARSWWTESKVLLLYRDYLDGALLHSSDVKTTEQLLGNVALRNLIDYKLNLTEAEIKALESLDLSTHRSLFGPYMWFSLITQSVSQNTAQLLLEYNRFAVPLDELPLRSPEVCHIYEAWRWSKLPNLQKSSHPQAEEFEQVNLEESRPQLPRFESTEFSALHLLTALPQHRPMIEARFGEEVYASLDRDQERLIRGIFSSYPLHQLPRAQRTLNPYQLYQEYLLGGRILLLPFKLIGFTFKLIALGVRWIRQKIDEIRFPEKKGEPIFPQKDFVVAQRKIDRTRKPIFMKMMHLRARLDFEYLGLTFDGLPQLQRGPSALFEDDLDFINAIELERQEFKHKQLESQTLLKELRVILEREGLMGPQLEAHLRDYYPSLAGRAREVLRALAMAYIIDFKHLRSFLEVSQKLKELFEDTLNGQKNRPLRLHEQLIKLSRRATLRLPVISDDREQDAFKIFWQLHGYEARPQADYKRCWERYLKELRDIRGALSLFSQGPLAWREVLSEVICYTSAWSEELVTLRMIQTLTMMDVQNYRSYIWHLGEYARDEDAADAIRKERELFATDSLL